MLDLATLGADVEALLGDPFDSKARTRIREGRAQERLPLPNHPAARWADWWRAFDFAKDDDAMLLATYMGATDDIDGDVDRTAKRVLAKVDEVCRAGVERREPLVELAVRARVVRNSLRRLKGGSLFEAVLSTGWRAVFGPSLVSAQALAKVIRATPVLILGEPGTGKELLAQSLLLASPGQIANGAWERAGADSVNLAGLPPDLVAGTLFGHKKGAYTGASQDRSGLLERCSGGAVFLDEVADLPPKAQVGLLRCLQEGRVRPLGADEDVEARPRVISATHRDLHALVEAERFRVDLFHRLSGLVIRLPPVRERLDDIPALVEQIIARTVDGELRMQVGDNVRRFLDGPANGHDWPGNVRELIAVVHSLALGLEPQLMTGTGYGDTPLPLLSCAWTESQVQSWYAHRMRKRSPSASEAARRLGIDRSTLTKRLRGASREL